MDVNFKTEDKNNHGAWEHNWRDDGNLDLSLLYCGSPKYGAIGFCNKFLFGSWCDGLQLAYMVVKYTEDTRRYIEDAGDNLQVCFKGYWDEKANDNYAGFNENPKVSLWKAEHRQFIEQLPALSLDNIDFSENTSGQTVLKMTVPGLDDRAHYVEVQLVDKNGNVLQTVQSVNRYGHVLSISTDKLIDKTMLNDGDYKLRVKQVRNYPINRTGYDNSAKAIVPDTVLFASPVTEYEVPQLRLAKNLNVENHRDGTATVRWTSDKVSPDHSFNSSDWVISYSKDSLFPASSTTKISLTYAGESGDYSQKIDIPDRNGDVRYYFRVTRNCKLSQNRALYDLLSYSFNTSYATINNGSSDLGKGQVTLKWTLTDGIWTPDMSLRIVRDGDKEVFTTASYEPSGSYVDHDLTTCKVYNYRLQILENKKVLSSSDTVKVVLPDSIKGKFTEFSASKGYYNNRVVLKWKIDSIDYAFNYFIIKRKTHGVASSTYTVIASSIARNANVYAYSYTDDNAVAGLYYDYQLVGVTQCGDSLPTQTTIDDIGFVQPNGVVTGQVLFESGQPVEGVTIDLTGDNVSKGASLYFAKSNSGATIDASRAKNMFTPAGGTLEMYVKFDPNNIASNATIASQQGGFQLCFTNSTNLFLSITRDKGYSINATLDDKVAWNANGFNHIAMSYKHDNDNSFIMQLTVNGHIAASFTGNMKCEQGIGFSQQPIVFGYNQYSDYRGQFKGYIDEIRVWNSYRSATDIAQNYDCYLSGQEAGLKGYYHCDMIFNNAMTYDISGDGNDFNENHLTLTDVVADGNYIPTAKQLGLRAHTDARGNYLINSAPYSRQGTLYTLVATLGVHQFSPATKTLFFNNNAATHNNIDFTDISSFNVSGTVVFAGGTYPVEGVQFKVDGSLQLSSKGGAIMSDEEGHFSLSVPVGTHTVQAYKVGHTLTQDGFILDIHGNNINYQRDYSDLRIADSTRVRFIGRICGGDIQASLPVGFSLSKNNLETGLCIKLEHNYPNKYKLSDSTHSETLTHQIPTVYQLDTLGRKRQHDVFQNTVEYSANDIAIYANDSTGEFYADVLPIDYTIRITTSHYGNPSESGEPISFKALSPLMAISEPYLYNDSLAVRKIGDSLVYSKQQFADTIKYAQKRVFELRTSPTLTFKQVYGNQRYEMPYYGEQYVSVKADNNQYVSVQLFDPKTGNYALSRPLYEAGRAYQMECSLAEVYRHYDQAGNVTWSESVPVKDATFHITNTMAQKRTETLAGDTLGKALYTFTLTEPDLVKAEGQISMSVEYNKNKSTFGWEPPFADGLCFYTGSLKDSKDYVTGGPNQLFTILRDPPGSNSYSYLEAGHTIQKDRSYTYSSFEEGKVGINFQFGTKIDYYVGLGVGFSESAESSNSIKVGWEHSRNWAYKTNVSTTMTTTQRIATSADETCVGANADVFVGAATNYSLAFAKTVLLVDKTTYRKSPATYNPVYAWMSDSSYVLTLSTGVSCNQSFSTTFMYPQSDIVDQEIPRLEKLLITLLNPYSAADSARLAAEATKDKVNRYMLRPNFDPTKQEYGADSSYYVIRPQLEEGERRISADTIQTIRGWINTWKWCLGRNEYEKWKAYQKRSTTSVLVDNYSIAGGATMSMSEQYATSQGYNYTYENKNGFFIDPGNNMDFSGGIYFGMTVVFEEHAGNDKTTDKTTTESYTHTKGFELVPNTYERLSVDVLHEHDWSESDEMEKHGTWEKDHNKSDVDKVVGEIQSKEAYPSFIFYTRGGQTCCPHEPEVKPVYMASYLQEHIRVLNSLKTKTDSAEAAKLQADLDKITPTTLINGGTQSIDKPSIKALKTYVGGVPSGETAYIPIEMTNASETGADRPYYLVFKESSNNQGLSVAVDGTALGTGLTGGSGVSFLIPAGATLQKTLAITKGSVLDYNNITLYLVAGCNAWENKNAIKDSCSFSVHFTAACSSIDIKTPSTGWVYNTELPQALNPASGATEHYLNITLTNFDINYDEFDHIELQYKPSSNDNEHWNKIQYFYATQAEVDSVRQNKDAWLVSLCQGGNIDYKLFLDTKPDQQYDIRAVTYCRNGNQLIANYSAVVTGVKDTYHPRLYGNAQPANGILGVSDEIQLTFNEPISSGLLTYNNFSVSGLLNEAPSDQNVSVHLDAQTNIKSEASFYLSNNFTIEGYFRQTSETGRQTLFTVGAEPHLIRLVLDKTNKKLVFNLRNGYASHSPVTRDYEVSIGDKWIADAWNHVAVMFQGSSYDYKMTIMLNFVGIYTVDDWVYFEHELAFSGPLTLGGGFVGNIDQVRVWTTPIGSEKLREISTVRYSSPVVNLMSCYNMDENEGTTLHDIAGGRHMNMSGSASWSVIDRRALYLNGKSHAALPIGNISVSKEKDYTIECWFRAADTKESVILSTPLFDGKHNDNTFILGITADGKLYVRAGQMYTEIEKSVFTPSGKWSHFAFTVGRSEGFARLYVDGKLLATVSQDNVGTIAGSHLYLGAQVNRNTTTMKDSIYQFFNGCIDEVRLWDFYRPQYQLEHLHMEKPDSSYMGLLCYYPFERYKRSDIGVESLVFSPNNFVEGKSSETAILNGATESFDAAPVTTTSSITRLDHTGYTFTASEDGINFTLTKPLASIEHTILTVTATDVRDQHGNKMLSPVSWSFYVDRNPLQVDDDNLSFTTPVSQSVDFDILLTNRSGSFQSFTLYNMPTWLSTNLTSGVLFPNSTETLQFTSSESLSIGTHTALIYLSNGDNVVIPILITVIVEGEQPSEFTDQQNYPYSMSIMARIEIDGVASSDTRDMLLAYNAQDVCVGSAHTAYFSEFDAYYVNLQAFSQRIDTSAIEFMIYDASTGKNYAAASKPEIRTFSNDAIYGTPANPVIFSNTDIEYRQYNLTKGWNWISMNMTPTHGWKVNTLFGKGWNSGDQIKLYNAANYADYSTKTNSWEGKLDSVDAQKLLMINLKEARTRVLKGKPIDPSSVAIPIQQGWNGIGYLPQVNLSVTEAMGNMKDISEGDVIKSQTAFAMYSRGVWIGSLKTLYPGEGYMFKHNGNATTLVYPSTYAYASTPARRQVISHETTMSLVAQPVGIDAQDGDRLTAYMGAEAVGEATLDNGLWFMSIASDANAAKLSFVYSGNDGQRTSSTSLSYGAHAVVGSPTQPQPIEFVTASSSLVAYPSPVQYILYYNGVAEAEQYTIYTLTGECLQQGRATGSAQVSNLPSGVYILEVATPTTTHRTTFIKE